MPTDPTQTPQQPGQPTRGEPGEKRLLAPAAARALAEAAARRAERERNPMTRRPKELDGRGGPDPTRYGDWEVNGLASDF